MRTDHADGVRSAGWTALLACVSYVPASIIAFALLPEQHAISSFCPPNAALLAFLLLVPRRHWWALIAAALPAHLLIQVHYGIPLTIAIGWFVVSTGAASLGAYLISSVCDATQLFVEVRALMTFLVFGVLLAPVVTSFLVAGVASSTSSGHNYWLTWSTFLFPNMLASLTIAPIIVTFYLEGRSWVKNFKISRWVEGAVLLGCVVLMTLWAIVLGTSQTSQFHFAFLVSPFLLWATLRFGVGGLSTCLLVMGGIVSWGAMHQQQPNALPESVYIQISLGLLSLPFMFLGVLLKQYSHTKDSLRESKVRLIDSQEQERGRIARELHDGIGQSLALLQLELAQLETECSPAAKSRIKGISNQVREVSSAAREISHGLHPSHLEYVGLKGALKELCREFGKDMVLTVDFGQSKFPESLAPEVSLSIYRVTQEALHNVSKYSMAKNVGVRLEVVRGALVLEVQDDGVGFIVDRRSSSGIGLSNMQERIDSVGGIMSIKSARMQGTKITASVPLKNSLRRAA